MSVGIRKGTPTIAAAWWPSVIARGEQCLRRRLRPRSDIDPWCSRATAHTEVAVTGKDLLRIIGTSVARGAIECHSFSMFGTTKTRTCKSSRASLLRLDRESQGARLVTCLSALALFLPSSPRSGCAPRIWIQPFEVLEVRVTLRHACRVFLANIKNCRLSGFA